MSPQRTFPQGGLWPTALGAVASPLGRVNPQTPHRTWGWGGGTSAPAGFKITCPQWAFRSGPSSWGMPTAPWPGPKTSVTQSWLPPLYSRRPMHTRHPSQEDGVHPAHQKERSLGPGSQVSGSPPHPQLLLVKASIFLLPRKAGPVAPLPQSPMAVRGDGWHLVHLRTDGLGEACRGPSAREVLPP